MSPLVDRGSLHAEPVGDLLEPYGVHARDCKESLDSRQVCRDNHDMHNTEKFALTADGLAKLEALGWSVDRIVDAVHDSPHWSEPAEPTAWESIKNDIDDEHSAHVELSSGDGRYRVWCSATGCDFDPGSTTVESEAQDWGRHHEEDPGWLR